MPKKEEEAEETKEEAEEKEETTEKDEKKERYTLEEVPTQTAIMIKDKEKDLIYSENGILLEVLNKLDKIEKAVA